MEIYLGATLLSGFIYFVMEKLSKKRSVVKIMIAFLPMLIVSAIRYDVGWDYLDIYTNGFFLIGQGYMPYYFSEIPFDWLVKLIYILSGQNPDWLFFICAIITFAFLAKACKDQSVNIVFSILLIFLIRYYFLTLNIVRQGIAMSICLYAIKFIKEKNFKKYFFTILLASCFHMMSLIYIFIYFLCQINWKKKKNILIMALIPIVGVALYIIVTKFTKYGNYIGSQYQGNQFLWHEIILSGSILMLATIEKNNIIYNKEYFKIYYIIQIITFIAAICSRFLPVADRIVWLFYVQNIFFIPIIIKNIKQFDQKLFILIILIILMSISVYAQVIMTDSYNIIPYKTIFQK